MKKKKKSFELVIKEGKPKAVILDINEYRKMLERLEDIEDLALLEEMSKKRLSFKKLDDFLKEHKQNV